MLVPSAMSLMYGIVCALMIAGARAFIVNPTLLQPRAADSLGTAGAGHCTSSAGRPRSVAMMAAPPEGAHGMRSRFLPVDQLSDESFAPRIVQVAGVLPDLTVADVMAVGFTPAAEMGMWQYDFTDPGGPQLGTVAVPGGEHVHNLKEPVAIVCPNEHLNIQMPNDEKTEMLVVLDRANREYEFGKFFLWNTPTGLVIRYFEGEPTEGYECVGRVGVVLAPFLESMRKVSSGFEEEDY